MNEKNDNSLEFDDEFEDGFDDSLDDEFYQDTLDENFESDNYDLENFDDEFETEFDDELEADFDQEAMPDESLMAKEKKGGLNLSFNTIVIIGAVIVGFIVLVVQVTKAPSGGQGGERFVSALSHQGADDGILSEDQGEQANQTSQNEEESQSQETLASTQIEGVSQEEAFLFEPDVLDAMGDELNAIPQPAPIMEVEETTDEVSLEPNIEDVVLSDVVSDTQIEDESTDVAGSQQPRPPVLESVTEELVQEIEQSNELLGVDNNGEKAVSLQDVSSDSDADQTQQEVNRENVAEVPTVSVDLSSIEEKLDQITSRLDDMDVQMSQMQGDVSSKIDSVQDNVTKLEKRVESVAARAQQQTASPRSSSRQAPGPKPVSQKAVPSPQTPSWELKAAQPGKAWIAQKGSSELKPIQVGDRVNGLGQIQNITFDGGRWRVIGSAKSLTQ